MKWINTIVIPVIISIITLAIAYYYFTDKPDITYYLTPAFSTTPNRTENRELYQYIIIQNSGSDKGERIIVTADLPFLSYEVKKYAEADTFNVTNKRIFQLEYPVLPPNGEVQILIKNIDFGLTGENIKVNSNAGLAREIFQQDKTKDNLLILMIVVSALIMILSLLLVTSLTKERNQYQRQIESLTIRILEENEERMKNEMKNKLKEREEKIRSEYETKAKARAEQEERKKLL